MSTRHSEKGVLIDLRSDTVTRPTAAMRAAMSSADVGDDVYGEDPTVNALQQRAAALVGKEAALLLPSGTMGNLTALLALAGRGQEVLLGDESHIFHYEAGGASALGGLVYHTIPTHADGALDLERLAAAIRPHRGNAHLAPPGVICLENTHNRQGGAVVSVAHAGEVARLASAHGVPVHLDGARIFNAAVAAGCPVTAWTSQTTTVQFCLSKGLSAPAGSILAGPAAVIERAWRFRKMLGGGMRQAGVLAAAGLVALDTMVDRLADDHAHARHFAAQLAEAPGLALVGTPVQTNIVIFEPPERWTVEAFVAAARVHGVLLTPFGGRRIRAMTHADVTADDCLAAAGVVREIALQAPASLLP